MHFLIHGNILMSCCCVPPGRIRSKAEVDESAADAVLSLNIISAKNIKSSHNSNRYLINCSYSPEAIFQGSIFQGFIDAKRRFLTFCSLVWASPQIICFQILKISTLLLGQFLYYYMLSVTVWKRNQATSVYVPLSQLSWRLSGIIAWSFPFSLLLIFLLICSLVFVAWLCASFFLSVHSLFPPAAAGLLIVLRLSIDKDIDRYHWPENIRLFRWKIVTLLFCPLD